MALKEKKQEDATREIPTSEYSDLKQVGSSEFGHGAEAESLGTRGTLFEDGSAQGGEKHMSHSRAIPDK